MPRRRRVFVEGGIYHVYNRFARGAELLKDEEDASRFLAFLRRARDRDGLTVFAWCLMSNHYHVALRAGAVPLSRSMGYVQARFGQSFNRRRRSTGPLWQSRYKAKLVEDPTYMHQLIVYIHLNPVTAGVVGDPVKYRWSGHREILGKAEAPLIAVDEVLSIFGSSLRASRRAYVRSLEGARQASWRTELPGRLPWWKREPDRPLEPVRPSAWIDASGRGTGRERRRLTAEEYLELACGGLGIEPAQLAGRGSDRATTRLRCLVTALGVERWSQQPRALGQLLGRRADVVSRWVRWGGERRQDDTEFSEEYEGLDGALSDAGSETRELRAGKSAKSVGPGT